MAVTVDENTHAIKMTKGDTLKLWINLKDSMDYKYCPSPGDRLRFAMKSKYDDPEPLLVKDIPISTLLLVLNPEDTKNLKAPAVYVYDIEMTYANGDVDTVFDKCKLRLTEEVY